jgi:hypothetical protein
MAEAVIFPEPGPRDRFGDAIRLEPMTDRLATALV